MLVMVGVIYVVAEAPLEDGTAPARERHIKRDKHVGNKYELLG